MFTKGFLKFIFLSAFIVAGSFDYSYAQFPPPPERSFTNLIGAHRIVDEKGIVGNTNSELWITDKTLTSDSGRVDIHIRGAWGSWHGGSWWDPNSGTWFGGVIHINSSITNNGAIRVGLRVSDKLVSGSVPHYMRGFVFLRGNISNTFTGVTEVIDGNLLHLNKSNGATAIQGDIVVKTGAYVLLWQSNQIADTSTVTLDGREEMVGFLFDQMRYEMSEKFHKLVVIRQGLLAFHRKPNKRTLFLDDILIEEGGILYIRDWVDEGTKLLVRKDSEHLQDALHRIKFEGLREPKASIKDYDANYWEVGPGFPEPASYGAILVGVVGFVVRRRRRSRHKKAPVGGRGF